MESKLKKYIKDNKINIDDLSNYLNLSKSYINHIINENQRINFDLSIIKTKKLIEYLNCKPEDVLSELQLMVYYDNIYPQNIINTLMGININSKDYEYLIEEFDENLNVVFKELPTLFNETEIKIIESRYKNGETLKQCGEKYNLSRERIRQIQIKIISKLNKNYNAKYILLYGEELWKMKCEIKELEKKELELKKQIILNRISKLSNENYDYLIKSGDELLYCNIELLNLSLEIGAILTNNKIKTIEQLVLLNKDELCNIKNLNKKNVKEIIDKLKVYNIKFKYEDDIKKEFKLN